MTDQPETPRSRRPGRRPGYISTLRKYEGRTRVTRVPEHWNIEAIHAASVQLQELITHWNTQIPAERRNLPRWKHTDELLQEIQAIMKPLLPEQ